MKLPDSSKTRPGQIIPKAVECFPQVTQIGTLISLYLIGCKGFREFRLLPSQPPEPPQSNKHLRNQRDNLRNPREILNPREVETER